MADDQPGLQDGDRPGTLGDAHRDLGLGGDAVPGAEPVTRLKATPEEVRNV